jgi:hypothetical protein
VPLAAALRKNASGMAWALTSSGRGPHTFGKSFFCPKKKKEATEAALSKKCVRDRFELQHCAHFVLNSPRNAPKPTIDDRQKPKNFRCKVLRLR